MEKAGAGKMTECYKTVGEIAQELLEANDPGEVVKLYDFFKGVMSGNYTPEMGDGYFHNGQYKTGVHVWGKISLEDLKHLPYVIWYNKSLSERTCSFEPGHLEERLK